MWWFLKRIEDNDDYVIYAYGFETRKVTGKIVYDKMQKKATIEDVAENDTANMANRRLLPKIYRIVNDENCPIERMIACG